MGKNLVILVLIIVIFILGISLGIILTKKPQVRQDNKIENQPSFTKKEMPIVGVDDKGFGVIGIMSVEVKPGSGLVLVNINNVLADYLTQLSARNAALIASNFTNKTLSNTDIIYNIQANASIVEGPSAGSVMAIDTIAALTNRQVKPNIYMTGAISIDGSITAVGGITEKAKAVAQHHGELFVIPASNYIVSYSEQKACTNLDKIKYCEIKYIQDKTDLNKFLGVKIQQVKNIYEAVNYTLI